jgi:hypothetical protein
VAHQPTHLSRLVSAIRACRVRQIGHYNISKISEKYSIISGIAEFFCNIKKNRDNGHRFRFNSKDIRRVVNLQILKTNI